MRLLLSVCVAGVALLAHGCVSVGGGSGTPTQVVPPPPPPASPCGRPDPAAPNEVIIPVADNATIPADYQYVFLEKPGQKIIWTVTQAAGKTLSIAFEDESAFTRPAGQQTDWKTVVIRRGGLHCEAHKYSITVEINGTPVTVDPILIIRE